VHEGNSLDFLIERKAEMFVTVYILRAKAGEEDAIIALHEDWQRNQNPGVEKAYLSWELLGNMKAPCEFIAIARFKSEELAQAMTKYLDQDGWYSRLKSLLEEEPVETTCRSEWQACQQSEKK
jgi:hypothetical protein